MIFLPQELLIMVMLPSIIGAFVTPQIRKSSDVVQLPPQQYRENTIIEPPINLRQRSCYTFRSRAATASVRFTGPNGSKSAIYASSSAVSFLSPLVDEGYPPAVDDSQNSSKPLLLYLPGFDGTIVAPFLQFPEMSTEFDVRGMTVGMEDRSTLAELREYVLAHIRSIVLDSDAGGEKSETGGVGEGRPVYIVGESFGGILALEVAKAIKQQRQEQFESKDSPTNSSDINLQGLVLINPATSYARSNLAVQAPPLTRLPSFIYPFALLTLLPLFTDSYALRQLLLILQAKALPSIIDTPQREAYMGRMAFSLPSKLKFMPRDTLRWRLEEWLAAGSASFSRWEQHMQSSLAAVASSPFRDLPILIVVGEVDETLPSISEAQRLSGLFPDVTVHVVPGAGHACTSGSRVDLTALMRDRFPQFSSSDMRKEMKEVAVEGEGVRYGMEPRYDGAVIGLSPLLYWSDDYYRPS